MVVVLLVACSGDSEKVENDPIETDVDDTAVTEEDIAPNDGIIPDGEEAIRLSAEQKAKYYKVVEFMLPEGNFRDVIVDYMRKQSSIEWVCREDFSVSEKWDHWGIALDFKKGQTYYGIPYADTKVSYIQFQNALVDGTYTAKSSSWKTVYGVQCISSIMNSIQQFDPTVAGTSNEMMPGTKEFQAVICGDYKIPKSPKRTLDIKEANGEEVMYKAYMQLQKGDIIMTRDTLKSTSHFRVLVEDPTVYTNATGKVIPSRCSVKTIEQTNAFDSQRTDGVKTTWFVDHIYSFTKLYETNYIPLTLESYSKPRSEMEVPYIALDKELDPEVLAKKSFDNTVVSNFPIRYIDIEIINESGTVVSKLPKINMPNTREIELKKYMTTVFKDLESGKKYTLVLSAGIAIDSCELDRAEFVLS